MWQNKKLTRKGKIRNFLHPFHPQKSNSISSSFLLPRALYTADNFSFMYFPERFSQASLLISPKQNYNVLSGILIFCREQDADFQLSAQHISKQDYVISITKIAPWICCFLSKVWYMFRIWHWSLANSFSSQLDRWIFSIYFPNIHSL